jgi:hypothetical protein
VPINNWYAVCEAIECYCHRELTQPCCWCCQGLFHLAIPMYERVLRFFELSERDNREVPEEYLLCRETAYNLSLIYKQR